MRLIQSMVCALALGLLLSPAAMGAFSWDVQPDIGDDLSIKIQNWEPAFADVVAGDRLYGVGVVTSIENTSSGATAWSRVTGVKQITLVFNNYDYDPTTSTATTLSFDAGNVSVWFDDSPELIAGPIAEGTNAAPDVSGIFSDGTKLMDLVGNAGVIGGDTLRTTVTGPNAGSGYGFLDVVPGSGSLAAFFNSDAQSTDIGTFADLRLDVTLKPDPQGGSSNPGGPGTGDYEIFSNDPISGRYIPEPTSAIVWAALSGLAVAAGRRRR